MACIGGDSFFLLCHLSSPIISFLGAGFPLAVEAWLEKILGKSQVLEQFTHTINDINNRVEPKPCGT